MAKRNSTSMSILSPSWFSSEVHKPSFHIIERELEDLFEQRWNCIMNTSHLEWKMHCNPTVILRGKTDESANAGDTEDDTVVGVSVFMVFINDAQSHRCETCDSFVKYMQLRGTDERLDSQPQAQITDMHMHMHMHVRRSPRALWKTVCKPVFDCDIMRTPGILSNTSSFVMCPLEVCCFVRARRRGGGVKLLSKIVNLQILGSVDDGEGQGPGIECQFM